MLFLVVLYASKKNAETNLKFHQMERIGGRKVLVFVPRKLHSIMFEAILFSNNVKTMLVNE